MPNPQPKPEPPPAPITPADEPERIPGDPQPSPDQQIHDPPPFQESDGGAEDRSERQRRKIQKQLDEALEDSFPASDPVSIVTSQEEEDWGQGDAAPAPTPGSKGAAG